MERTPFQNQLAQRLPEADLRFDEPMARHTSFRIGGPAEVMAFPRSPEELAEILRAAAALQAVPAVLGAGTNVLAPDEGIRGLVICLKDALGGMERRDGNRIFVMAGVTMARAAVFAANQGLSGLEFAHGIPGTVGGGVYMNAGAYGGEIGGVCTAVELMDRAGNRFRLSGDEMGFSYRHSRVEEGDNLVIGAEFTLIPGEKETIQARMRELAARRTASQPLDLPSAGSAFKRPVGGYAAALIDQAGLKGFRVGDAAISEKHAGFAVNLGRATASEVRALLRQVSDRVYAASGIRLEPEIRLW